MPVGYSRLAWQSASWPGAPCWPDHPQARVAGFSLIDMHVCRKSGRAWIACDRAGWPRLARWQLRGAGFPLDGSRARSLDRTREQECTLVGC